MRQTFSAFLVMVVTCSATFAQTSQPGATTATASIDALVADLGSDVFRVRQEAQKKIVSMGNAATQPVNELLKTTKDPEVQQRATEILAQIAAADRTSGSRVTLKFKNAPAMEVYKSLYEQAHAKLRVDRRMMLGRRGQDNPVVSIDVTDVPFWQAMRTLNKQTEWGMETMGGDGNLGMDPFKRMQGPASINGPFMVVARDDFGPRTFDQLSVFVEPRLELVSHDSQAEILEMLDDNGDPIPQRDMPMPPRQPETARGNCFEIHQNFMMTGREKIAYLKGTIGVSILAQKNKVEIENIGAAQNLEKNENGRRFVVHMMNPEPGDYFLVVIAYNTDPPTPGFDKIKFDLIDREDRSLTMGGQASGGGKNRIDCNIEFKQPNGVGTPSKLIMEFPSATEQVKIPFEFGKRPDGAKPQEP